MPFRSPWSRIPLGWRWGISLFVAALLVVALVRVVDHNNSSGEVPVSAKNLRVENRQAQIVIGQQQAPHTVTIPSGASASATLTAGVRHDLRRQITEAVIDGPLQKVRCVVHGGTLARTRYHCLATVESVVYPFYAVSTRAAHRIVFCEKIIPPEPSENIPVSKRCTA